MPKAIERIYSFERISFEYGQRLAVICWTSKQKGPCKARADKFNELRPMGQRLPYFETKDNKANKNKQDHLLVISVVNEYQSK